MAPIMSKFTMLCLIIVTVGVASAFQAQTNVAGFSSSFRGQNVLSATAEDEPIAADITSLRFESDGISALSTPAATAGSDSVPISPCPGNPACSGIGTCDTETSKCQCPDGFMGPDCSVDVASYRTVVLPCTAPMPEQLLAACKKPTEAGECAAYRLFANKECSNICPYIQGGNCTMASRQQACQRRAVRCTAMCMSSLAWYCDTKLETMALLLKSGTSETASGEGGEAQP